MGAIGAAVVVLDAAAWAGHVIWRDGAEKELAPVLEQIDELAIQIAEDDAWIETTSGLMQEYGQPGRFASRVQARGRRAASHRAMVDSYNGRIAEVYRRFYWAPVPPPRPPIRTHLRH